MKVVIDYQPKNDEHDVSASVRLYPETIAEVTRLEWMFEVFKQPGVNQFSEPYVTAEVIRCVGVPDESPSETFHHIIVFRAPPGMARQYLAG